MHDKTYILNKTIYHRLSFLICLLASILCVYLWIQDRSVFLDEANLILNIHELTFTELGGQLLANQRAPLLFTWIIKTITLQVGQSTMAYRVFPLILVLSSFWLLRHIVIARFTSFVGLGILILFGIHELVQKYGSECKQYSADLFSTILLIFLYERWQPKKQYIAAWILVGSLLMWLSMSSVLVLIGIGFRWLLISKRANFANLNSIIYIGIGWLISLLANYYLILAPAIDSDFMQSYHTDFFLNIGDWESIQRSFMVFVRLIAKKTTVGISAVILLILCGILRLSKNDLPRLILYTSPILLSLILSSMGMYSLLERLVLFTLPLLLLILGEGFTFINNSFQNKYLKWTLLTLLTVSLAVSAKYRQGLKWIVESPVEDLKTVLIDINKSGPPNHILISKHAYPSYHHYVYIDKKVDVSTYQRGSREHNIISEFEPLARDSSWILLSHVLDLEKEVSEIKARYTIIKEHHGKGTTALLLYNGE